MPPVNPHINIYISTVQNVSDPKKWQYLAQYHHDKFIESVSEPDHIIETYWLKYLET